MKEMRIKVDELQSICANNKIVGQGGFGIVYQLDDDMLFKFNYKDFIDCFEIKNNSFDFRRLMDISDEIESRKQIEKIVYKGAERQIVQTIRKAGQKQGSISLTALTQGLVYCNDYCIGYLLKNHKNMVNLYDYLCERGLESSEMTKVLENIGNSVQELMQCNIYHYDLTTRNILMCPENNDIQIIDFEDQIRVYDEPNSNSIKEMQRQLKEIEEFCAGQVIGLEDNMY